VGAVRGRASTLLSTARSSNAPDANRAMTLTTFGHDLAEAAALIEQRDNYADVSVEATGA
jgi:hypothetical protein